MFPEVGHSERRELLNPPLSDVDERVVTFHRPRIETGARKPTWREGGEIIPISTPVAREGFFL